MDTTLVGANDNDIGHVGIMPAGQTYSMKIMFNSYVGDRHCEFWPWQQSVTCIEADDFIAAIDYAIRAGIKVVSMSFSGDYGFTVHAFLHTAYYSHDVLLVAALGNTSNSSPDLVKRDYVMGVAAANAHEAYVHEFNLQYREISGFAYGMTTRAYCYDRTRYCTLDHNRLYTQSSGTSAATATIAGIAGLVRAYNPSLTAANTRQRLKNTARGPLRIADAYAAVLGIYPLIVEIRGPGYPGYVETAGTYTWEALPSNGKSSYTYAWERSSDGANWSSAGSSKSYSASVYPDGSRFFLRVTVQSGSESATAEHVVSTSCSNSFECPV